GALRAALGRAHARGGLRPGRALSRRRAVAAPERPRLRRRGARARRRRGRLPAPSPSTGRRAGTPPPTVARADRLAGAGEPGPPDAQRSPLLPRRPRAVGAPAASAPRRPR